MKLIIAVGCLLLVVVHVNGAGYVRKLGDVLTFTNKQGNVFYNAQLVQADKDGVVFRDTNGISRVALTNLSMLERERMGIAKLDQELIDFHFAEASRKKKLEDVKNVVVMAEHLKKLKLDCENALFKTGLVRTIECRETGASAVVDSLKWASLDFATKKKAGEALLFLSMLTNPKIEFVAIKSAMTDKKIAQYDRSFGLSLK